MADMLRIGLVDPTAEPATGLLEAAEAALTQLYGPTPAIPRELFMPPDGGYFACWQDDVAVAGGGFVRHAEHTAEVRRMFVVLEARSRGIGRRLLAALEDQLRLVGYERVILDTGARQPHAEMLYRTAGYSDIENYRGSASRASFWGAKSL